MDKRANLRKHFQTEAITASTDKQYQQRTAQLNALENTVVQAFNALIQFMDGKTTKTEVVNQLKSISTPDVDKLVPLLSKLDTTVQSNKVDLKPLVAQLTAINRQVSLIPKSHPEKPEPTEKVKVTNLDEIILDTSAVEKAIKALKLDVKAPIINTEKTDISPLKDVMLDLLKVIKDQKPVEIPKFPEIPKTDLTKVETKLETSNKLLKEITEKKFGGGGGGGNGTPYIDSTGKPMNVILTADGKIPVEAGATSTYESRNDTTTDTNLVYLGKALPGSDVTDAAWQIKRYDKSAGLMSFADDETTFTKQWSGRTTYGY